MSGQRVGYVRVSTTDQNPGRQLEGIALDRTFVEYASGGAIDRPQLSALLLHVREGDTVLVHSIDRLARNLDHLRDLVGQMVSRGVRVEFVKEALVFTGSDSPLATMMLSVMGALAEFERALIRERQREGIAIAHRAGKYTGRKPALSPERAAELVRRAAATEANKAAIAREFGVSSSTLYAYLRHHRHAVADHLHHGAA